MLPASELWTWSDPMGEALHLLRMTGTFYFRAEFSEPWGIEIPPMPDTLWFHVVTHGSAAIVLPPTGEQDVPLAPGGLALVPHGAGHGLRSAPDAPMHSASHIPHDFLSERYAVLRHGGGGERSTMVCGAVRFDHPAARALVALLPPVIRIGATENAGAEWLSGTLGLLAAEVTQLRPGGEAVITRLSDIVVIQAIRAWIESDPAARTGWLGALQDPQIGRALTLIHRDPAREWTVAALAAETSMSRSAFAARFTELVGEAAMHYVTRWRMHTAMTWLADDTMTVGEISGRLGYRSEAAFSRAFKRVIGVAPGAARRAAISSAQVPPSAQLQTG
ncbi:AraC family transcriptional regulator [Pseudonocardia sp. TRM90224]|uniref:AraC family transcriptional regulator n=1 Tax=Pseudonocardia sp. TRM90224 TaxID=2812678 RepID=UPI001E305790|nr:AraC family transcriptional regulator [Pseudonocardia sp. TRM90224]